VAKVTPTLEADLGFKLFMMFATINIGGMAVFSLSVNLGANYLIDAYTMINRFLPETKGRSLEEMDIIFGSVSAESREAFIERALDHKEITSQRSIDKQI
jgi:hypothetical protein